MEEMVDTYLEYVDELHGIEAPCNSVDTMLRKAGGWLNTWVGVNIQWMLGFFWVVNVAMVLYIYYLGSWRTSSVRHLKPSRHLDQENPASIPVSWREINLVSMPGYGESVQLLNAVAGNSSNTSSWDRIFVHGWIYGKAKSTIRYCCFMNSSGSVRSHPVVTSHTHWGSGKQFICNLKKGEYPIKATVSETPRCHRNVTYYLDVDYPFKYSEEVAIFAKVIYGNISAINLIVWFEIHKLFGVNKVVMYPYDLYSSARKVLHYYNQQGLLEVIPYSIPGKEKAGSRGYPDAKTVRAWATKESAIFDGHVRLKGYKYMLCFDPDEFAIPANGKTYIEFLDEMFAKHPKAAGFYFKTYLYIKDWGSSDERSPFDVGRYRRRTKAMHDRIKHVTIPSRLSSKGFSTHNFNPAAGYKGLFFQEEEAAIHHFRKCRKQWLNSSTTGSCFNMTNYYDDTMFRLLQRVQDKVLKIAAELNL